MGYRKDYSLPLSIHEDALLGNDKCWYCGDDLNKVPRANDHFWPKSMGGRLKVACCISCNRKKRNWEPLEFIDFLHRLKNKYPENAPWQKRFDRMIHATESLWDRIKWSVDIKDHENLLKEHNAIKNG